LIVWPVKRASVIALDVVTSDKQQQGESISAGRENGLRIEDKE
jgi:hypothetical protein